VCRKRFWHDWFDSYYGWLNGSNGVIEPKNGDSKSWPELRAPDFVGACHCK
jgi:hypothetical protein